MERRYLSERFSSLKENVDLENANLPWLKFIEN